MCGADKLKADAREPTLRGVSGALTADSGSDRSVRGGLAGRGAAREGRRTRRAMLKIRQLKAQQDEAKKAAAAEGGAAAGPKQTPGQLRIQKGACARPAAWSARAAGPGPTRPACACCRCGRPHLQGLRRNRGGVPRSGARCDDGALVLGSFWGLTTVPCTG